MVYICFNFILLCFIFIDIQHYENLNLKNIVTPVRVKVYEKLLKEAGYDAGKTKFLVDGFTNGFSLGYEDPK